MLLGLLGSFLPALPGVPLIFAAALLYAYPTNFEVVSRLIVVLLGLFALLAFVVDFFGTAYGARRFGASNWGTVGGALGGLVGALAGALFFGIGAFFGLLLGTVGGVFVGECLRHERHGPASPTSPGTSGHRHWRRTGRAASGVFVGYLLSTVAQGVLGLLSVVVFVLALIY